MSVESKANSLEQLREERLARLIRTASRSFNRALSLRLAKHGVSFGQWTFLRILWKENGLSQRELAEYAGLTEPTTHKALIKLESLGLITRSHIGKNKRRQHALLTESGWALRDVLEPLAIEANDIAVKGLNEAEQLQFRHFLLNLIDNLAKDEAEAASRGDKVPATRVQTDF